MHLYGDMKAFINGIQRRKEEVCKNKFAQEHNAPCYRDGITMNKGEKKRTQKDKPVYAILFAIEI
jgi:hypothetical protein